MDNIIIAFRLPVRLMRYLPLLIPAAIFSPQAAAEDLMEIYNLAVDNDPQIRQARAQYNATHTNVTRGRAELIPSVTLSASTSRETQGPADPTTQNGVVVVPEHSFDNGFNSNGFGLSIQQNLINFEAWYSYQAVLHNDEAAATSLARSEQDLIMRVASAYFDVLRSIDNLEAYQAELDASERILEQTEQRFDAGLIPITDVYESQASYDLAQANLLVEQNNLDQRYEALEAITGRNHEDLEILGEDFPIEPVEPDSIEQWVDTASENNLEIIAARQNLEASEEQARAARASLFPTVDISANYNWNETGTQFSFISGASERSSISLNFSYPIFTGGANLARKREAYYNRNASEEALLQTERTSLRNTRNSYRSVRSDVLTIRAMEQAIVSARSQLEATEAGAEAGTRNIVDVVIAQRQLFQALRDHANARYNYVIDTLSLKQAAGLLSPQDIIDLNQWLEED